MPDTSPPFKPANGAPARHAISLLVHEQVAVIVDQCRNLECFAPTAVVMIHVSPSATFRHEELVAALAVNRCTRSMVNPVSVATRWGQIVEAHFANIDALASYCDADSTISFHSSNDLLLAELPPMGTPGFALYEQREVSARSIWSSGRTYIQTPGFAALLAGLGCRFAVGSQIEGSSFPYGLLTDMLVRLRKNPDFSENLPPIAEEMLFATFAANHLGPPIGHPYILFRPLRIGAAATAMVPGRWRSTAWANFLNKAVSRIGRELTSPNASPADIDSLIAGRPQELATWAYGMARRGPAIYHGVKRIERRIDDPLRQQVRAHTDAVLRQHQETGQ